LSPNGDGTRVTNAYVRTHWCVKERVREGDLEIVPSYTSRNAPQYPYPPPSFLILLFDGNKANAPGCQDALPYKCKQSRMGRKVCMAMTGSWGTNPNLFT
jgi:hypothetical protein